MSKTRKRIVAVLLVFALSLTVLATTGTARTGRSKITSINQGTTATDHGTLEQLYRIGLGYSGEDPAAGTVGNLYATPGDELRIPLTADLFHWEQEIPLPNEQIELADLRRSQVNLRIRTQAGAGALKSVSLVGRGEFPLQSFVTADGKPTNQTAYISVKFADQLIDVNDLDFSFDLYLSLEGQPSKDLRAVLSGVFGNPKLLAGTGTAYADLSDGSVLEAQVQLDRVELYAGGGVSIHQTLFPGWKYYAVAAQKELDDPAFTTLWPAAYPTIVTAYKLDTVNARYGTSRVRIDPKDPAGRVFYVYGEDMRYYGTTQQELVYSDVYFLSTKLLDEYGIQEYGRDPQVQSAGRVTVGVYGKSPVDESTVIAAQRKQADESLKNNYRTQRIAEQSFGYDQVDRDINFQVVPKSSTGPSLTQFTPSAPVPGADVSPNRLPVSSPPPTQETEEKILSANQERTEPIEQVRVITIPEGEMPSQNWG